MSRQKDIRSTNSSSNGPMEERIVALAEQLGWLVGAAEAKTGEWLDKARIADQLARIRDGASELLAQVQASVEPHKGVAKGAHPSGSASGRVADTVHDKVHAPGKRHRGPLPSQRGVKHSNQQVAKAKLATISKCRGRG